MRAHWLPTLLFGLLLSACSTLHTPPTPTREEKVALAPTGKLRAAFLANSPIHATNDLKSGVAIDLGNELARRIGVPFEVVTYPSVAELFNSIPSGQWDIMCDISRATAVDDILQSVANGPLHQMLIEHPHMMDRIEQDAEVSAQVRLLLSQLWDDDADSPIGLLMPRIRKASGEFDEPLDA